MVTYHELQNLGLTEPDLAALRMQGYVEQDYRANGRPRAWRLRFRSDGHLRTVYLGIDQQRAVRVQTELAALQAKMTGQCQLKRVVRQAQQTSREIKRQFAPILAALGVHYHGHALRKLRRRG